MSRAQPGFDPEEFRRLACELGEAQEDEARLRTAIGRAYYAAYWVAASKAPPADLNSARSPYRHREVANTITAHSQQAGSYLDKMRGFRQNADYDRTPPAKGWKLVWKSQRNYMDRLLPLLDKMPLVFPKPPPTTDPSAVDQGGHTLRAPRPDKH